ncbi:MAG TPA: DNA polymerase III subunit alpha [Gammaproteobacteria bacterium]|nr:DNA polymerase III subunit alpha [Gammaproteobacteria bacterium]
MSSFVHLRLHTEYSLIDGLIRIEPLMAAVAAAAMPAVALTDQNNLFAMMKFYQAAEHAGIKPIIGADLWLRRPQRALSRFVLLCRNPQGYRHLAQLITRGYMENQREGRPCIEWDWLQEHADGLIALSGGREGDVGQALLGGDVAWAEELTAEWAHCFPDAYYLELQRTGRPQEEEYLQAAVDLAARRGLPVVATNDVRFLHAADYEAHEARVCIHEGRTLADPRRPHLYSPQQYLRSPEEMTTLFSDLPEALANTAHVAARCNFELQFGKYHLPAFPVPEGHDAASWLRAEAASGLEARLQKLHGDRTAERAPPYRQRLALESDVIAGMGFAGYFLIVADFIRWAKTRGIPVGPGRGSGAGSLVAYALGITELDPLRYDLLFERFLNPERVSMPDFDVDFCMDRRDEVIHYVTERYGQDRVAQIITHGTMAAKAVVRDVGRVLDLPYKFVDQVAKLVPFALDMTLERALAEEPALKARYEQEEEVRTLIDLALNLEGLSRNAGRHAGGVVIAPAPLTDFMPLYCEPGGTSPVTQLDMLDVEVMGLVKFDFLGLRTLTIIDWALRDINAARAAQGQTPIDINLLPLDDRPTYDLIRRADTTAIFQLESRGMRDLIRRWQPDTFGDLVALVAMFRPGPLGSGMVEDFISRKQGRARVHYPHPALEAILKPTWGVIVYQEQVMQIAQVLAGYTLGAADLLRRAMGKKKPEEMAKQRAVFLDGAMKNGVKEAVAASIFDLMEKFAEYGFNKSHSAAYALVAYQTAWLKTHHGAVFMAAVLSSEMDDTDKIVSLIRDCRRRNIEVQRPDINSGTHHFTAVDAGTIRYGLGAIKGVGRSAAEAIVQERAERGVYTDLFDLCRRLDLHRVNRRVLEALIRAGALDALGPHRASLMATLGLALQQAEQSGLRESAGQEDLFATGAGDTADQARILSDTEFVHMPEWPEEERLLGEQATLGRPMTGHLIDRYLADIENMRLLRIAALQKIKNTPVRCKVAAIVGEMRMRNSRRGRMAVLVLDDHDASVEVTVYPETLQAHAGLLEVNRAVVLEGNYDQDNFTGEMALTAEKIWSLDQARAEFARRLVVTIDAERCGAGWLEDFKTMLSDQRRGACPVYVEYQRGGARARLRLGNEWLILPTGTLVDNLRRRLGDDRVHVEY